MYIPCGHTGLCCRKTSTTVESANGFTIVEILLAIFIFGIITVTVFGAFSQVLSNVDALDENIRFHEMVQNCINRMMVDLESIQVTPLLRYKPPEIDTDPDPYRFVGETAMSADGDLPKLRFTSSAHIPIDRSLPGGIVEITYYLTEAEEGGLVLHRADRVSYKEDLETDGSHPILCEMVKSLKFTYYDAEGEIADRWDSESDDTKYATPTAVGITLEIGNEDRSFEFETVVPLPVFRPKQEEKF